MPTGTPDTTRRTSAARGLDLAFLPSNAPATSDQGVQRRSQERTSQRTGKIQPGAGDRAKDAARTTPAKSAGRSAAARIASGPEYDSATMRNCSPDGSEARTTGRSPE